jgi:hypothetical protein
MSFLSDLTAIQIITLVLDLGFFVLLWFMFRQLSTEATSDRTDLMLITVVSALALGLMHKLADWTWISPVPAVLLVLTFVAARCWLRRLINSKASHLRTLS